MWLVLEVIVHLVKEARHHLRLGVDTHNRVAFFVVGLARDMDILPAYAGHWDDAVLSGLKEPETILYAGRFYPVNRSSPALFRDPHFTCIMSCWAPWVGRPVEGYILCTFTITQGVLVSIIRLKSGPEVAIMLFEPKDK